MSGICRDRVVVTGASQRQGHGCEHALAPVAGEGLVVVNDSREATKAAAEEIEGNGGTLRGGLDIVGEGADT